MCKIPNFNLILTYLISSFDCKMTFLSRSNWFHFCRDLAFWQTRSSKLDRQHRRTPVERLECTQLLCLEISKTWHKPDTLPIFCQFFLSIFWKSPFFFFFGGLESGLRILMKVWAEILSWSVLGSKNRKSKKKISKIFLEFFMIFFLTFFFKNRARFFSELRASIHFQLLRGYSLWSEVS